MPYRGFVAFNNYKASAGPAKLTQRWSSARICGAAIYQALPSSDCCRSKNLERDSQASALEINPKIENCRLPLGRRRLTGLPRRVAVFLRREMSLMAQSGSAARWE